MYGTIGKAGVYGKPVVKKRYEGTDRLMNGYCLCYKNAATDEDERESDVEKPDFANVSDPAGIVINAPSGGYNPGDQGWCMVDIVPIDGLHRVRNVDAYTDVNCAVGDLLGPRPNSYALSKAVVSKPILRVAVAADRSGTAGVVNGVLGRYAWDENPAKLNRYFNDFMGDDHLVLGSFTPAEVLAGGLLVTGSSVAAAYISSSSQEIGALTITPNTTNIGQLHAGAAAMPYLLSAGREAFVRCRVRLAAVDADFFAGLAITGAIIDDGSVPPLDDYIGFYIQGDSSASINIATNKDNGTDNVNDTSVDLVAATYVDLAFHVRNRLAGTAAGAKTIYAYVDEALTNSLESATVAGLINDDEAMRWGMGTIGGASAVATTIDRLEIVYHL